MINPYKIVIWSPILPVNLTLVIGADIVTTIIVPVVVSATGVKNSTPSSVEISISFPAATDFKVIVFGPGKSRLFIT